MAFDGTAGSPSSKDDRRGGVGFDAELATVQCTFGTSAKQVGAWNDQRTLTWLELRAILTTHAVGPKEGSCIVPATFTGPRRHKDDAWRIDVAMLDSDSGATLDEISAAVSTLGCAAAISSTHSHGIRLTRVNRSAFEAWLMQQGMQASDPSAAATFLIADKHMRPTIAAGARVVERDKTTLTLEHQPCPKYRVIVPLVRPWLLDNYANPREANDAWRERIEALAGALHLKHDPACTDTSRLFFLPRRPADGPPAETRILEGQLCDIFGLPAASGAEGKPGTSETSGKRRSGFGFGREPTIMFKDPQTGAEFDLRRWAAQSAEHFQIVAALRHRGADIFVGKTAGEGRHHIRCPNEDAHTQAGADTATFICDPGQGRTAGFVIFCCHAHCAERDRLLVLRQMLEQGWLKLEDLQNPAFQPTAPPPKPVIRIAGGALPETVQQAESALIAGQPSIYQRGPFVVRPGRIRLGVGDFANRDALQIIEVGDHALAEAMTEAATWQRFDERSKDWVDIDAPLKVATIYRQRKGLWRLPVLTGVLTAPTLRADGSVLEQPGYDPGTGLLLARSKLVFPPVPDQPTRGDALKALAVLHDLISTFPFVNEASRSVALSGLLTSAIRRSLRTAPMHAHSAPLAGSGKSLMVDLYSMVATGRPAGVIAQGRTEEELEKRLGALLLAGEQVVAIDNCEAPLGGEFLCSLLTQEVVRARILGRSEAPELPSNAFITATGNNLSMLGDMTRRTLMCQLDPQVERPELRAFARHPLADAKARRGELLVAALTVLRAYHVAGRPGAPTPLGSFEDWSDWVRGSLLWLGCADPISTMESVRQQDPRLDALISVLAQWHEHLGPNEVSARGIIDCATEPFTALGGSLASPKREFRRPDFREALLIVAGDNGSINSKRLGRWIAAHEGRLIDRRRIARGVVITGVQQWRLVPQAEPGGGDAA